MTLVEERGPILLSKGICCSYNCMAYLKLMILQLNKDLEDMQAWVQEECQSLREENQILKSKVDVEHQSLRLEAKVTYLNPST